MFQENINYNNNSTAPTSALAPFSLSSPNILPSSPSTSSSSSFINEYDTSNYFSRLPNETIFNIFSFVIPHKIITTQPYSPHKQLAILSQVCRLFNKIANDVVLWQKAFDLRFDSEAIIRAGIIDKNVTNSYGGAEGEGEGSQTTTTTTTQIQIQTSENVWKELYKERQIALNKIKNYIKATLPSPFVFNESDITVDFMEFNFDDENESDIENLVTNNGDNSLLDTIITNNGNSSTLDSIITNNGDGSTLDSTDQVDDNVHFNLNFNFVGNERNEVTTNEINRNNPDFTFEEDSEFRFQELEELSAKLTTEDIVKEHTTNDDAVKEDIPKDNTPKDGIVEENIKELDLEINLEYIGIGMDNTLDINVDDVVQDFDFVSEDLMKFDDPELDSIFDSDTVENDNLVDDTQNSNVVKNNTQHNEVLVEDTDNPVKEVDHVSRAQILLNPEINDGLDETYLQDYDESSKFLDHEEEPFKSLDYEESFDKDKPPLQDYRESPTKSQNYYHGESKLQEVFSAKSPNYEDDSTFKNIIIDGVPAREAFQLQEFGITNNLDKNEKSTNLQDLNDNQVEVPSKEIININEQESDLPDYDEDEEITYLPNYEDDGPQNENVGIENDNNDLPGYVEDEEWNLPNNENVPNGDKEDETIKENLLNGNLEGADKDDEKIKENLLLSGNIDEKESNSDLPDHEENIEENIEENNLPSVNAINNEEGNELPNNEEGNILPNIIENEIDGPSDYDTNGVETNGYLQDEDEEDSHLQHVRRNISRKDNDPELINILNVLWKICQENDGMNSEVLLEANVKELVVNLIRSLAKKDTNIECLSIALQILSILASWHPELTIDLNRDNSLWKIIHYAIINVDIFFPGLEDNIKLKQLILPALAGSAIHIFFHTILFNSPNQNQSEFIDYLLPPQLIPDSNIFNNVYNKPNLKHGEGVVQPFNEDFSGKWCGYYGYYEASTIEGESPMDITSLEFSPSEPGKVYYLNLHTTREVRVTDKVAKIFSGRGIDQVGEFTIKHGIITEKGNVNFIKSYVGAHSWIYDGVLLPVGICGRWGTPFEWCGVFWIWK